MGVTDSDVWHHVRVAVKVSKRKGGRVRDQQLVTNRDMQNLDGLGAENGAHTAKHRLHARPYSGTARVQGTPLRDGLIQQLAQSLWSCCQQSVAAVELGLQQRPLGV